MSDRIAIIGISGSGKTRLARELGAHLGLPVVHMDALFWREDWQAVPEAEYLAAHAQAVSGERWIIEGYVDAAMADRLRRADQVIFLDPPGWLCAWRVIGRWWTHRRAARPALPAAALERLGLRFLWTVASRAERAAILSALRAAEPARVVRRT